MAVGFTPDRVVEANHPLCSDELDLSLRLQDGGIEAIGFTGPGCSICLASETMLCEAVTGMAVSDAQRLAHSSRAMLQGAELDDDLGEMESLGGVRA